MWSERRYWQSRLQAEGRECYAKIYNNRRQLKLDFHWVVMKKTWFIELGERNDTVQRKRDREIKWESLRKRKEVEVDERQQIWKGFFFYGSILKALKSTVLLLLCVWKAKYVNPKGGVKQNVTETINFIRELYMVNLQTVSLTPSDIFLDTAQKVSYQMRRKNKKRV